VPPRTLSNRILGILLRTTIGLNSRKLIDLEEEVIVRYCDGLYPMCCWARDHVPALVLGAKGDHVTPLSPCRL
jgi:hypothetical protein